MKRKYYRTKIALIIAGLSLISTASAATIDEFSTAQALDAPGGISGDGIIGGTREVSNPLFDVDEGSGTFTFGFANPGSNIGQIVYDGTATLDDDASFEPVDLTDGGLADQFLMGITELQGSAFIGLTVSDTLQRSFSTTFEIFAPGLYTASLATNEVDLTKIRFVSLNLLLSGSPADTSSVSIDFVCTGGGTGCTSPPANPVPEPGSGAMLVLLAAALPLLGLRRRGTPRA